MSKVYHRYFTNNDKYGERKTPYLDSLAYTIQEFLYTEGKAIQTINFGDAGGGYPRISTIDCKMDGRIQLYDFMTMTLHCINAVASDYATAELKEYLRDLKEHDRYDSLDTVCTTDNKGIYIRHASPELLMSILWATWIYMKVFIDFYPNKALETRIQLLYEAIKESYPYSEEDLQKHPLIAHAPVAMKLMLQHIKAKIKKTKQSQSSEEEHAEDNSKLQARIAELEAELEKAKKQVADLEKQNKEQKDNIELLSTDIPEIDAQQKVRMELARKIMSEAGMNAAFMDLRGRKTKVATLMGTLLEIPTHTCASWLSRQELNRETHQKSIKEINDIFEALGLAIRV